MAAIFDIHTGTQINEVAQYATLTERDVHGRHGDLTQVELHQRLRSLPTGRDYRSMQRIYLMRRLAVIVGLIVVAFVVWQLVYTGFGPQTWDSIPAAGALQSP